MNYKITYYDVNGNPIKEVTLPADSVWDMCMTVASVPSAQRPPGTESVDIHRIED